MFWWDLLSHSKICSKLNSSVGRNNNRAFFESFLFVFFQRQRRFNPNFSLPSETTLLANHTLSFERDDTNLLCTYILNSLVKNNKMRYEIVNVKMQAYLHHFQKGFNIWRELSIYFNYPLESIEAISMYWTPMAPSILGGGKKESLH